MIKVVVLASLLISLAQVFPSCSGEDSGPVVIGWVEGKHRDAAFDASEIVINSVSYDVPTYFWDQVRVGDLVKWDGKVWTIVKGAGLGALSRV